MTKILFLDIDGVILIDTQTIEHKYNDLIGYIAHSTNCKIVITSSHRCHDIEATKEHLRNIGFDYADHVIGHTIRAYHYINTERKIHLSIPRGVEIKQWLDTHIHSNNGKDFDRKEPGKDFAYAIVDDDVDMLLEHSKYFVKTDSCKGLNKTLADKIIKILNAND